MADQRVLSPDATFILERIASLRPYVSQTLRHFNVVKAELVRRPTVTGPQSTGAQFIALLSAEAKLMVEETSLEILARQINELENSVPEQNPADWIDLRDQIARAREIVITQNYALIMIAVALLLQDRGVDSRRMFIDSANNVPEAFFFVIRPRAAG
ncbi:hypothetical protein F5Y18DRAFT_422885 [Xylariaceae sp. FL1019]|nr:hypothetical protein F5Y18DRAFT_422885 [Xylariaceae sp. FL1019]